MPIHNDNNSELRGEPIESERGSPAWLWLLGIVAVALLVGIFFVRTPASMNTADTHPASIGTSGSARVPSPAPSPSPNR
jgi:hypothetical protein